MGRYTAFQEDMHSVREHVVPVLRDCLGGSFDQTHPAYPWRGGHTVIEHPEVRQVWAAWGAATARWRKMSEGLKNDAGRSGR
jgi:hypothetical protein